MEGRADFDHMRKKLGAVYWDTLVANWTIWPGVQMLNFNFVSLNYQAVVVSVVALGWNSYMSLQNSKGEHEQEAPVVESGIKI